MCAAYCGSSEGANWWDKLLRVERQERQVEENREPVAIDDEEESQESVDGGFGDDVGVETVAQVNRVDVVTANEGAPVSDLQSKGMELDESFASREEANSPFQIAVHDGEEHLEEEVDGVDQHRQQVEPRFAGHDGCEIDKKSIPARTRIEDGKQAVVKRRRRRSAM